MLNSTLRFAGNAGQFIPLNNFFLFFKSVKIPFFVSQTPYRKSFDQRTEKPYRGVMRVKDCPVKFSLIFSFITILSQCRKDVYIVFDRIPL
jgi:hypothetical protein